MSFDPGNVGADIVTGGTTILTTAGTSYKNVILVLLTLAAISLGVWLFKCIFRTTMRGGLSEDDMPLSSFGKTGGETAESSGFNKRHAKDYEHTYHSPEEINLDLRNRVAYIQMQEAKLRS